MPYRFPRRTAGAIAILNWTKVGELTLINRKSTTVVLFRVTTKEPNVRIVLKVPNLL